MVGLPHLILIGRVAATCPAQRGSHEHIWQHRQPPHLLQSSQCGLCRRSPARHHQHYYLHQCVLYTMNSGIWNRYLPERRPWKLAKALQEDNPTPQRTFVMVRFSYFTVFLTILSTISPQKSYFLALIGTIYFTQATQAGNVYNTMQLSAT